MTKQIVFFDIDGTLLNAKKELIESAKKSIETLQNNGIIVALATGRPPFMFKELREELKIDTYIGYSGQYVVHEGELIYKNAIVQSEVDRLYDIAKTNEHPMIFMDDHEMVATIGDHPHIKAGLSKLRFPYPTVTEERMDERTIYQALLFCDELDQEAYKCHKNKSRLLRWHEYTCDVLPGGGHKAIGIDKLLDASGISVQNSVGIGDGPNDVEMLKHVGWGVAMGNAVEELKAIADDITSHVDDNGVHAALKKLQLI